MQEPVPFFGVTANLTLRIGREVELSRVEQNLCRAVAQLRYRSNREAKVTNSRIGGQSDEFTDLEGLGAELAFCKLFNVYPSSVFDVSPRSAKGGEDFGDAILPNGKAVDVKATKYATGKLVAVTWKKPKGIDYFALMVGSMPKYTFKGFMKSADLLHKSRLGTLGHGPAYIAHQDELKELEELSD